MAKSEVKYGNVGLGQINRILISLVGESAFYYYCEKYKNEWNLCWQSEEAFKKYIGRLLREEDSDYIGLNPDYENSVYQLVGKIFTDFGSNFYLPPYYVDVINSIAIELYSSFSKNEYPIYETYHFFEYYLYETVMTFAIETIKTHFSYNHPEYTSFTFSSAAEKYNFVFDAILKINKFSSKEDFYEKLADWCTRRNKTENPKDFKIVEPEHFKKIIALCVSDAKNPSWKNTQDILDFLLSDKETVFLSSFLIEAYISSNIENVVRKETGLPNERIEEFFKCFDFIKNAQMDLFENHIKSNEHFGLSKEKFDSAVKTIGSSLDSIFNRHIYILKMRIRQNCLLQI